LVGPALAAKIFLFSTDPNQRHNCRRLIPYEGALAIVTNVGVGCGGRGSVGRAIGVAGRLFIEFVSEQPARKTDGADAYGEGVWFRHPLLMSSQRRLSRRNRAGQISIRWRR
jgi:hypothetical protein